MKKFFKVTLITGVVLIGVGSIVAIAALGMGAVPGAAVFTEDGVRYVGRREIQNELKEEIFDWIDDTEEDASRHRHRADDWGEATWVAGGNFEDIRSIEVKLNEVDLDVSASESSLVSVSMDEQAENMGVKVSQEGSRLIVLQSKAQDFWEEQGLVQITVPAGMVFDEIDCENDAGNCRLDGIQTADMEIHTDAGNMEVLQASAGKLDISVDAGTAYYQGAVSEMADIESGLGTVELLLDGAEEDFNYQIEVGMGSVEINGKSDSGMGVELRRDNGAAKKMNLEVGMGNAVVNFTE